MSSSTFSATDGRAASLARRRALSQGKTALPAPKERVRAGFRAAELPAGVGSAAPSPVATAPVSTTPASSASGASGAATGPTASGRLLSMLRRSLLAQGKQALAAATSKPAPAAAAATPAEPAGIGEVSSPARARRAQMSRFGRGDAAPARPSRPLRQGELRYPPKVEVDRTHSGQPVSGLRIGPDAKVTGDEPGLSKPVTGTQYLSPDDAPARAGGPKVGVVRTGGGLTVTGTLVRSRVRITGDEAGAAIRITGEADQRVEDDLTPRAADVAYAGAQFQRQTNPHGHSVFGINLGRSVRTPGSRERDRSRIVEVTMGGQPVSGTAVGRSARVTGDEPGACRTITGDQYLAPAQSSAECGGRGGGTAPAAQTGLGRVDPVTGAKVTQAQTWGAQRVTGPDFEHRPKVTGDEPGSCAVITGTPYQGPSTVYGWCDPGAAAEGEQRLVQAAARAPVTGDAPRHSEAVTGTERGAQRGITGTPYYRAEASAGDDQPQDALARIAASFSVRTPQRDAQLRADRTVVQAPSAERRITGAFAVGEGKITGNVEFHFRPRAAADADGKRPRITGEGRTQGPSITGDAWAANPHVTGTEGYIAAERNPSERAGKPHGWAGAMPFRSKGKHEEPRQIVTGMVGWTAKSAAKVTLSGGAQG